MLRSAKTICLFIYFIFLTKNINDKPEIKVNKTSLSVDNLLNLEGKG